MGKIAAVDLGGTQMRVAQCTFNGRVIKRAAIPTEPRKGVTALITRLTELIQRVAGEDVSYVCVAAPGPLDPTTGVIFNPPNLPFDHTPVQAELHKRLGLPVILLNDADAAAFAEHQLGAGQGARNMVYLTIGTGLGGGLIFNGELYHGRGQAGEAGYMSIAAGSALSQKGYAEHLISGPAITRHTQHLLAAGEPSRLRELEEPLTAKHIAEAAAQGDPLAHKVITQAGTHLGILIASLMMLLHPDVVVLGGSVAQALLEPAQHTAEAACIDPLYYRDTPIRLAQLGDDAGLIGAALYGAKQKGTL